MTRLKAWLSSLWSLLRGGSRTAWGLVATWALIIAPVLLAQVPALQELAAAVNAPAWVRPTLTLIGAIGGAVALHARVDDQQTGANPQ